MLEVAPVVPHPFHTGLLITTADGRHADGRHGHGPRPSGESAIEIESVGAGGEDRHLAIPQLDHD